MPCHYIFIYEAHCKYERIEILWNKQLNIWLIINNNYKYLFDNKYKINLYHDKGKLY